MELPPSPCDQGRLEPCRRTPVLTKHSRATPMKRSMKADGVSPWLQLIAASAVMYDHLRMGACGQGGVVDLISTGSDRIQVKPTSRISRKRQMPNSSSSIQRPI